MNSTPVIHPRTIVHVPRRSGSWGQFFGPVPVPCTGDGPHTFTVTGWTDWQQCDCLMRYAVHARISLYGWMFDLVLKPR